MGKGSASARPAVENLPPDEAVAARLRAKLLEALRELERLVAAANVPLMPRLEVDQINDVETALRDAGAMLYNYRLSVERAGNIYAPGAKKLTLAALFNAVPAEVAHLSLRDLSLVTPRGHHLWFGQYERNITGTIAEVAARWLAGEIDIFEMRRGGVYGSPAKRKADQVFLERNSAGEIRRTYMRTGEQVQLSHVFHFGLAQEFANLSALKYLGICRASIFPAGGYSGVSALKSLTGESLTLGGISAYIQEAKDQGLLFRCWEVRGPGESVAYDYTVISALEDFPLAP